MLKQIALAAALLLIAGPVYADTPVLDQRQERQTERIRQGAQSGELTRREAANLVQGQVQLRRMEQRAKSDGEVTARERVRLQQKANVESRQIYRKKHNGRTRGA